MIFENNYLCIFLQDYRIPMRVGLYDWERADGFRQTVSVSVSLYVDPASYMAQPAEAQIVDYAAIGEYLKIWRDRPHTPLLETLLKDLLQECFMKPQVMAVKARIAKTEVITEAEAAGLEIFIRRQEFQAL
jgi:dihydroneopterin aldolase